LARKLDVDQIEVSYNNLKEQRLQVIRTVELSRAALKFQMHLPRETIIVLTDSLKENLLDDVSQIQTAKNTYQQRVEYSLIEDQQLYNNYDIKSTKGLYFPKLNAVAAYGYNPSATKLVDIPQSARWINYD